MTKFETSRLFSASPLIEGERIEERGCAFASGSNRETLTLPSPLQRERESEFRRDTRNASGAPA